MQTDPFIAITQGDVAGIGPEIVLQAVQNSELRQRCRPLVIGHPKVLRRAAQIRPTVGEFQAVELTDLPTDREALEAVFAALPDHAVPVLNPCQEDVTRVRPGTVDAAAGEAACCCLLTAARLASDGIVDAIATAPLNKESLHAAGHAFPGHTEILADFCGVDRFAMMLHVSEPRLGPLRSVIQSESVEAPGTRDRPHSGCGLSVAHVTLHTSIASVPGLLTVPEIVSTTILMHDFLSRLGSERLAIGVAALNPHGGEHGLFGSEEARVIEPAVRQAREQGCQVTGPLPVDTLIRRAVAGEFDGVIAMYHDQGHIPVKLIGFDSAVNITLGLPIVRTSPTHGTAFDRAWNPQTAVDPSGMIESVLTAANLCQSA